MRKRCYVVDMSLSMKCMMLVFCFHLLVGSSNSLCILQLAFNTLGTMAAMKAMKEAMKKAAAPAAPKKAMKAMKK